MADGRPPYRTVTPYLVVADAAAELTFLKAAFDAAEVECHREADGRVTHAEVTIGDSLVMIGQAKGPWKPTPAMIYLWVPDVDATYACALEAGATSEAAPEDKDYGHRNAGVVDPGGVTWWIAAPVKASPA